jgi:TolA-binding protein
LFNHTTIALAADADPETVEGMTHETLERSPIYAALYKYCAQSVHAANTAIGDLQFRCQSDAKRIRAYEENTRRMNRDLDELHQEVERLQRENADMRAAMNDEVHHE